MIVRSLNGNRQLTENHNILVIQATDSKLKELEIRGETAVIVATDNKLAGIIGIVDTIKENAKEAINSLKSMKIEVVMLTGDNERTANAAASKLGIDRVIAQVLPQEKEQVISKLKAEGGGGGGWRWN
jgi:Cu+-exporting ATPase